MRLGLVARCDNGGLGTQTWEFFRHMRPERTLIVHTGHMTRGSCDLRRYEGPGVATVPGTPSPEDVRAFLSGLDVVFTCEAVYQPLFVSIASSLGVRVVIQSNPELHDAREFVGAEVVLPTSWHADGIPHTRILPVPIASDRFTAKRRTEALIFYHVASPAMADRNGTKIVMAALRRIRSEVTVIIRGALSRSEILRAAKAPVPANVTLEQWSFTDQPYYKAYPDADVLLMPRRYGGLSLPIQEAAALGMPVITTALEPQRGYPHAVLIPVTSKSPLAMKGGVFDVWDASPVALAEAIDSLANSPARVAHLSDAALAWAESLSWSRWKAEYLATLGDGRGHHAVPRGGSPSLRVVGGTEA